MNPDKNIGDKFELSASIIIKRAHIKFFYTTIQSAILTRNTASLATQAAYLPEEEIDRIIEDLDLVSIQINIYNIKEAIVAILDSLLLTKDNLTRSSITVTNILEVKDFTPKKLGWTEYSSLQLATTNRERDTYFPLIAELNGKEKEEAIEVENYLLTKLFPLFRKLNLREKVALAIREEGKIAIFPEILEIPEKTEEISQAGDVYSEYKDGQVLFSAGVLKNSQGVHISNVVEVIMMTWMGRGLSTFYGLKFKIDERVLPA